MAEKCQELEAQQQKRAAERLPDQPWARPPDDLLGELEVEPETGLTDSDADERRKRFGANCIRSTGRASILEVAVDQFKSLMVVLLGAAAIVAFAVGDYMEAGAVLAVILINATIGFATEVRAIRSMEALEAMGRVESRVRRGGGLRDINAQKLVPGDIVIIEAGDVISADLRLIEANNLQANESALTGESVPVEKGLDAVDTEAPLAERTSMLYRGTAVTRGSGEGLVVATGMNTELGEISALTESAEESVPPRALSAPRARALVLPSPHSSRHLTAPPASAAPLHAARVPTAGHATRAADPMAARLVALPSLAASEAHPPPPPPAARRPSSSASSQARHASSRATAPRCESLAPPAASRSGFHPPPLRRRAAPSAIFSLGQHRRVCGPPQVHRVEALHQPSHQRRR